MLLLANAFFCILYAFVCHYFQKENSWQVLSAGGVLTFVVVRERRLHSLVPFEYADVCHNLRLALNKASAKHPVVIIIDAAEQIYSHDIADTSRPRCVPVMM